MITNQSTVSEMKHALLKLGCPNIRVIVRLVKGSIVFVTVETSHPKIGDVAVERDFTAAQYLNGPMQPVYWEIYQRVSDAIAEGTP
jgi:hypothetical protein